MSDPDRKTIYAVDSSTFMDWQGRYYPGDVFKSLLLRVDELVGTRRFLAPALVRDEIKAVGTADLIAWVDAHPKIFVPTAEVLADAQAIQNQFAGLRDPKAEHEEAHAYVIALGCLGASNIARGGSNIRNPAPNIRTCRPNTAKHSSRWQSTRVLFRPAADHP